MAKVGSKKAKTPQEIFDLIVAARGIKNLDEFVNPSYEKLHNPMLLPDMKKAIARIKQAIKSSEKIAIYGDYDIDGLTATTILSKALTIMGLEVFEYLPDRFLEGYGMSKSGVDVIKTTNCSLIITVDCGSRSLDEIKYAKGLGIDVIVTDHHEVGEKLPDAVAVVNAKREDSKYPWRDLAGVGVAFKLIRALQQDSELGKLFPDGQEKWLLDLVALGTVCDVVDLLDENRTLVWWGLKVMSKSKWPGVKALAEVSGVDLSKVTAEDLGFRFGPRLNASGRMKHAQASLDLLMSTSTSEAKQSAEALNLQNRERQADQKQIFEAAKEMAEASEDDVLILADKNWSHGINGIVASKICEKYHKPVFIMQIMDDKTKGSARSFGDFHLADALKSVSDLLISGGGHKLAAGATIKTKDLDVFRRRINQFYKEQQLEDQSKHLAHDIDVEIEEFAIISEEVINKIDTLAPFGNMNPAPIFISAGVNLDNWRPVGADNTHAKSTFTDGKGYNIDSIGFSIAEKMPEPGAKVDVIYQPQINEFNGRRSIQLFLIDIKLSEQLLK